MLTCSSCLSFRRQPAGRCAFSLNLRIWLLRVWLLHASAAEPAFAADRVTNVRLSQGADNSDVPGEWLSFSPRHYRQPIGSFAVCPGETVRFFGHVLQPTQRRDNRATRSLSAWCLDFLIGAFLQMKPCRPWAVTKDPHWHWCGTQRFEPSRSPTATLTASSSSLKPQDVIGIAYSQSPLCGEDADKYEARWCGEFKLASTTARSARRAG